MTGLGVAAAKVLRNPPAWLLACASGEWGKVLRNLPALFARLCVGDPPALLAARLCIGLSRESRLGALTPKTRAQPLFASEVAYMPLSYDHISAHRLVTSLPHQCMQV